VVLFLCGNLNNTPFRKHYLPPFLKEKRCVTALAGRRAAT